MPPCALARNASWTGYRIVSLTSGDRVAIAAGALAILAGYLINYIINKWRK